MDNNIINNFFFNQKINNKQFFFFTILAQKLLTYNNYIFGFSEDIFILEGKKFELNLKFYFKNKLFLNINSYIMNIFLELVYSYQGNTLHYIKPIK